MIRFDFDNLFDRVRGAGTARSFHGIHDLIRQLNSADAALATVNDAVFQTDTEGGILRANQAAERLTGLSVDGLVGHQLDEAVDMTEPSWERRTVCADRPRPEGVFRILRLKGGHERLVLVSLNAHAHGRVYVLRDMSGANGIVSGLDGLTGLPGRRLLESHINALYRSPSRDGWFVLYLDLDQFKVVNDLCGHRAGDELLRQLTRKWLVMLGGDEILARLGGDEFCAVLARKGLAEATAVAEKLVKEADDFKFEWGGQVFRIGASAGLVNLVDADGAEAALAAADSACWSAKENGRNRLRVFDRHDSELRIRHEQMAWLSKVAHAIEEDRLELHFQRICPITGDDLEGHAEILVRMRDENGLLIPPDQFIPAAERYHQMPRLDRWVVSHVCRGVASGAAVGRWSINLSGTTFSDPKFTDWVRQQIINYGIPPGSIGFELTETAAISDLSRARFFIAAMRDLGCTISLDDFGSGVSSFAYLKKLAVDYLKIDGTFVRNLLHDRVDLAMVEAIHRVGSVIGIPTIAEYVETPDLLEPLRRIGINYAQGYGIHRPEPWIKLD